MLILAAFHYFPSPHKGMESKNNHHPRYYFHSPPSSPPPLHKWRGGAYCTLPFGEGWGKVGGGGNLRIAITLYIIFPLPLQGERVGVRGNCSMRL
jgi:hypothetical protein